MHLTERDFERGVVSLGNTARLQALMRRAAAGESITVGALGGSITEGFFATDKSRNFVSLATAWWRETFPRADVRLVNAGIGGTNSDIGVCRFEQELMAHRPDLVLLEYAVNDAVPKGVDLGETYETIVRRVLASGAALVQVFMPRLPDESTAEPIQRKIGAYYQLPAASPAAVILPRFADGSVAWEDYSGDSVHPNDAGHRMAADTIIRLFEQVKAAPAEEDAPLPDQPLGNYIYRDADGKGCDRLTPTAFGGFYADPHAFFQFANGWSACGSTDPIVFDLPACRRVHLMLVREIDERYGDVIITVTAGGQTRTIPFQGAFPGGWGGIAEAIEVFRSDVPSPVRVAVASADPDHKTTLLRVMTAN